MIDINKKYKTVDAKDVTIYTVSHGGVGYPYPIVGSIDGVPGVFLWNAIGELSPDSPAGGSDIEDVPRIRMKVWIALFQNRTPLLFLDKKEADDRYGKAALVEVDINVREGFGV